MIDEIIKEKGLLAYPILKYDDNENLIYRKYQDSEPELYKYDDKSNLLYSLVEGIEAVHTYNNAGFLVAIDKSDDSSAIYERDEEGRPLKKTSSLNGEVQGVREWGYDENGFINYIKCPSCETWYENSATGSELRKLQLSGGVYHLDNEELFQSEEVYL